MKEYDCQDIFWRRKENQIKNETSVLSPPSDRVWVIKPKRVTLLDTNWRASLYLQWNSMSVSVSFEQECKPVSRFRNKAHLTAFKNSWVQSMLPHICSPNVHLMVRITFRHTSKQCDNVITRPHRSLLNVNRAMIFLVQMTTSHQV